MSKVQGYIKKDGLSGYTDYINPYYLTDHELYNVPREQFLDYLQREGRTVKDYWTGEEYVCFMRRNKDTNQTNDNISLYYPIDSGLHPGSLITLYDQTYLVLNQESRENRSYYRSDGLNADVVISTYNKKTHEEINLPCFAYDLTSITPEEGSENVMSAINGNVELMTGDCEMARKLGINCEFYAMGNWYQIGSINFKTGIARIGASIILSPSNLYEYGLEISLNGTYTQGESVKLDAKATIDGFQVPATLSWSSPDSEIVTITEDGNAVFTGVGNCTITCYWKEHDVTETIYIEVIAESKELKCEIIGENSIRTGNSATYTAKFYQADGVTEDESITPVWSLELPSDADYAASITERKGKTVTVKAGGSAARGKSVGLSLTDAAEQYHSTKTISITSWI